MNKYLNIENRAATVKLNEVVHKDSADDLIDELERLYGSAAVVENMKIGDVVCSADNALESVNVEINSPGGSVMEGQRIYNALRGISSRGVEVTTTVSGLAASMGSVILMAGDSRKMTQGSRVMIHEASTLAHGDAAQLKTQSELLESISAEIATLYAERSGKDAEDMRAMMKKETWMDAEQAKENGFIDTIIKDGLDQQDDEAQNQLNSQQSTITNNTDMAIFSKDNEIKDRLATAEAENVELVELANSREAEAKGLAQDLSEASAKIEEITAKLDELETQLKVAGEQNEEISNHLKETEENQSDFDAKVSAAASAKMAELGVSEPVEAVEEEATMDAGQLLAEYRELQQSNPSKASAFWQENKAALLAG
jgi:ATP-dependent Clp endopeptidase proteolytic subunit ClpP